MWYIFPQIIGLGRSEIAVYYSIADREEAECYMQNDLLRGHLLEISEALLQVESDDATVSYRITCNNGNQRTLINP